VVTNSELVNNSVRIKVWDYLRWARPASESDSVPYFYTYPVLCRNKN